MRSGAWGDWGDGVLKDRVSLSLPFPVIALLIALLTGCVLGAFGTFAIAAVAGILIMAVIIILRQDELAVTLVIAVHLYVDWYLGLHLFGPLMALILLVIYFLGRSPQFPWVEPPGKWLWALFLVLTIYPAIRGGLQLYDLASYYPSDILGALLMFWLGIVIARNNASVRKFFILFAGFGTLLAVHTIIQATTGTTFLGTAHYDSLLSLTSNFQLDGLNAHRAGSFFIDPNWNGTFFATMFFLPLGLFIESSSLPGKAVFLAEMALILPALLFTYSNGAWIGVIAGVIAFIVFVGRARYRILLLLFLLLTIGGMLVVFPAQITNQFYHASRPLEISLRVAVWQTATRVMLAYPLLGVGLGYENYLIRSDPFRVPAQFVPLAHPHNSYLEWGAMAGIPVLCIFLALLILALWLAIRNWAMSDQHIRPLLGGGIASTIALSINSWSINAWTLPALSMVGWLILGVIASPLLRKSRNNESMQEKNNNQRNS